MPDVHGNMIYYSDYFAFAAEAGLNRARAIAPAITTSVLANLSTIAVPVNAESATKNLSRSLDTSYEWYWQDGQNLTPMQKSFDGLSEYITRKSGLTVDAYITQEGIQVEPIYAQIHDIFSATDITEGNIKT